MNASCNTVAPATSTLKSVQLEAVPRTSKKANHRLSASRSSIDTELALPVFEDLHNLGLSEAVAVVLRNSSGKPIHGVFFAQSRDGIVKLTLVDSKRGINTDADPVWTAFRLVLSIGKLKVRDAGGERELPWSIDDITIDRAGQPLIGRSEVRIAVRGAYVQHVLPTVVARH